MSCSHFQKGNCGLTVSESIETVWVNKWPTVQTVVKILPCAYSSDVWIGNQCYAGRFLEGQLEQKDCPLYRATDPALP